ncbi:MAG: hypothetical protein EAX96_07460 [Candidatus Lokiarchaeota archaeon]|nr:hypothetical protein [Candidatus Lokiarchaeota archaeon]
MFIKIIMRFHMKIWIVYDSNFGHCKKVAETISDVLEGEYDTHVGFAKKILPEDVISEAPNAIIIGGPIYFGYPSRTIVNWIKKFYQVTKKLGTPIKKGAAFYTWSFTPKHELQWQKLFQKFPFASEFFPQVLSIKVNPSIPLLNPEECTQVNNFGEKLKQFLS